MYLMTHKLILNDFNIKESTKHNKLSKLPKEFMGRNNRLLLLTISKDIKIIWKILERQY